MLILGFTNQYYTLWHRSEPFKHFLDAWTYNVVIRYTYRQNLSTNYDEALAKITKRANGRPFEIDLDLRGERSWFDSVIRKGSTLPPEKIAIYPTLRGEDIASIQLGMMRTNSEGELKDMGAGALWLEYIQGQKSFADYTERRRGVLARRRLCELGVIVRYPHIRKETYDANWGTGLPELQAVREVRQSYCTVASAERREERKRLGAEKNTLTGGHHFTAGERVELKIKEVDHRMFDGDYGTFYVVTYATECGKIVKYKGGTYFEAKDEFKSVKATIEHSEYKGEAETSLKRIAAYVPKPKKQKHTK